MPKKFLKEKHLSFKKIAQSRFVAHMPKFQPWEVRLPRKFDQVDLAQEIRFYHRAAYFFHLKRLECVAQLKQNQDDPKLKSHIKSMRMLNSQGNKVKDLLLVKAAERHQATIVGQYEAHGKRYVRYRIGDEDYVSLLSMTGWKDLPVCEPVGSVGVSSISEEERQSILDEFSDMHLQHQAMLRIHAMNKMFTQMLGRINHRVNVHRKVYPQIKKKVAAGEIILIGPDLEEVPYTYADTVAAQNNKPQFGVDRSLVLGRMAQKVNEFWSRAGGIISRLTKSKA